MNTALLISTLVVLSGFSAALHALLTKRDSKSAFGWIGFCLVLPIAGPLIYLLFGINRVNQSPPELSGAPGSGSIAR